MPAQPRQPVVWRPDTAAAFLEGVRGDRLVTLWHLGIHTGLRRGELLALKWQDLDLDAATLIVRRSLTRVRGQGLPTMPPKTAAGRRTLALDAGTVAALKAHRTRQMEERMRAGPKWANGDWCFATPRGTPWTR